MLSDKLERLRRKAGGLPQHADPLRGDRARDPSMGLNGWAWVKRHGMAWVGLVAVGREGFQARSSRERAEAMMLQEREEGCRRRAASIAR
ncbi:hypothetical protein ACRE_018120 [Hapsidospora chrysogenum ATCC 11550]|uniref:Uncharacterized protein n=1 Tax=Hapsidospora chrysogenum (strain ATCC 11550 / CBS 779.69 / DSM 880 / IAM 14645 / JCM 23072 / IMI 49137) TaxID=857340 RepID=A0A086TDF4_HAPC1|nr:hypothetical protein ACRE_018120 [Hapsidospora chrysogenum ATCC 11550]